LSDPEGGQPSITPLPEPPRRRRVHSVNFDAADGDWIESVVDLLKRGGLPKAGRSEVVRAALAHLRRTLAAQDPAETVTFFLECDREWRLARIELPDSKSSVSKHTEVIDR
jgi:hypothetical protein